jgi:radical SAM superfamily enzyme YgiQ (UPF0313 family)
MDIKKTLLINPPFDRLKGMRFSFFPIGLGYLAAESERNGFCTRIYNADISSAADGQAGPAEEESAASHRRYMESLQDPGHHVWKEVERTIAEFRPDMVGIGVMTPKYGSALMLSRICKAVDPGIRVVWGGPHPTLLPDQCLANDCVDVVVRGEGEATWLDLCRVSGGDWEVIDGISFKRQGRIIHNQSRALMPDLDGLPFLGRDLVLNPEGYSAENFGVVTTSRGCPFRCGYCCAPEIWGRKIRHRSVEKVVAEMAHVQKRYRADTFMFWDDTFTADRAYTLSLCDRIIAAKLDIRFNCCTRVNIVDDELLGRMRAAGCHNISFGVETGSPRMLKLIQKDITLEQVERALKLCRKYNIDTSAFFMIGFPQETRQDVLETIEYYKKIRPNAGLNIFTPYPGTELFRVAKSYGLVDEDVDWSKFHHTSSENSFVKDVSKAELYRLYEEFRSLIAKQRDSFSSRYYSRKSLLPFYLRHPGFFVSKFVEKLMGRLRP